MWDDGVDRARVWARRVRLGEVGVATAIFGAACLMLPARLVDGMF